jgi:hypothetical protein
MNGDCFHGAIVPHFLRSLQRHPLVAAAAAAALLAAVAAATGSGAGGTFRTTDTRLCGFPLEVTVRDDAPVDRSAPTVLRFELTGPRTITIRNGSTGKRATLRSSGTYAVDTTTGNVSFGGHQVWFWATGTRVPFMTTDGRGTFLAPEFVLSAQGSRARVIDPCALVAAPASTLPRRTKAPWGLPASALGQIRRAGLVPVLGALLRHDHAHLDVIVNGRKVVVPGGVGLVEPVDRGPCPQGPQSSGDCATRHGYFAAVANSPLHTHASSGIIHIESDRLRAFTLGEFFDEWGVRLDSRCVGGYCTGGGSELRVYLDGRRVAGSPRRVELSRHREIAVVFGGAGAFRSVPARYAGAWPEAG